jgi:hypothetical protein
MMSKIDLDITNLPDTTVNVREVFGIDSDITVPAYKERSPTWIRITCSTAIPRSPFWPASPTTAA